MLQPLRRSLRPFPHRQEAPYRVQSPKAEGEVDRADKPIEESPRPLTQRQEAFYWV